MRPRVKLRALILVPLLLVTVQLDFITNAVFVAADPSSCQILDDGITDCSDKGLTYIPRDVPPTTKILKLDKNQIQIIESDDFPTLLPDLEELVLSDNNIRSIDTSTFCHKLPSLQTLRITRNKLTKLPDLRYCKSLKEIYSSNNEITEVNGTFLTNLRRFEKLDLSKNKLTILNSSMLPVNTSLRQLILHSNDIGSASPGTFVNVITLEKLRLSRNRLTLIPKALFEDLGNLQSLDLSRNRLTVVEHWYFDGLISVKSINLEKNRLSTLLDGSFYACRQLEVLNLESNFLTSVKAGPLFGLGNLRQLIMRKNNITSIDPNTWVQANSIDKLDLSRNSLEVIKTEYFTRAGNIREMSLAHNNIHQIEEKAFDELRNLEILDLSHNDLSDSLQSSSTTVFQVLSQLRILDLADNQVQTISTKLLHGLDSLTNLVLKDNPVTTVESYAFSTPLNLSKLELKSDKLVCDCKISWLPPWLQQKQMVNDVRARCALPSSLKGRSIFDINAEDFRCDDGVRSPKPLITRHIRQTTALRGSNVTLTCIATTNSLSPVNVVWSKDNKIIPQASGKIETDATTADGRVSMYTTYLRLVRVTEEDQGNYQCGFQNEYGSDYSEQAELQVLVYPSFTNTPSNVVVKRGQDAKLLCEATGYPPPYLSWSKDGGENFPAARERRFQVNPNNLNEFIITDAMWEDRGVYYCNATNIAGSIISNATLDVMTAPMFTEPISCTNTRAGVYLLKCQVDGNPKTPIVWSKDGQHIQPSEKYVFSVTYNSLFIMESTAADSGVYSCSASNTLGKVTQKCRITIENTTASVDGSYSQGGGPNVSNTKKAPELDQNTITGLIIIAVVCCIVGTSLIWVVIIYQTRKRRSKNNSDTTDGTTEPLNRYTSAHNSSAHKIGDCISNGSSQSKSDSFLEYRSSQDSPSTIYSPGAKYPTMDSELASAMEPLNPSQESQDSIPSGGYAHHTLGSYRGHHHNNMVLSASEYYVSENAHPFSTFQPTRHHRVPRIQHHLHQRPQHSISTDYIPYIANRHPPHEYTHVVLHEPRVPSQPPQAVVNPVNKQRLPSTSSSPPIQYEEPAYMNLPRSAVTPKRNNIVGSSDYMNVEPKDIHIYQNTSILNIPTQTQPVTKELSAAATTEPPAAVLHDNHQHDSDVEVGSSNPRDSLTSDSVDSSNSITSTESSDNCHNGPSVPHNSKGAASSNQSHVETPTNSHSQCSSLNKTPSTRNQANQFNRSRREGMADSSFVERKYGLFTESFLSPKCSTDSRSSDRSRLGHNTQSNL